VGDFLVDMAFAVVFRVCKEVIKNPGKKEAMRRVCVKLRDALVTAYPD